MTFKRPVIGISLDYQEKETYSSYPWHALRANYFTAVARCGGTPIAIPYVEEEIENYLSLIDGLIIPGGRFDITPILYGDTATHHQTEPNPRRTGFETSLCRQALAADMPVLGICGGMQLLNVIHGGTLIQYIPDQVPDALTHEQESLRHQTVHDILITPDTLLSSLHPASHAQVNSSHRQAIKHPAPNSVINAVAPDQIIEGIEFPQYRFCLGAQWHPEFLLTELDQAIIQAFIDAARPHE